MYADYKVKDLPDGVDGDWVVDHFTIDKPDIETIRASWVGRDIDPGTYTRLRHNRHLVMSDTPAEIRDHSEIIRQLRHADGNVLIHGLGIGMVLGVALRNPKITRIDVVEKAPEVIRLVGPHYTTDPRVNIYEGDAFTFAWPKGKRWNLVWHDIWNDLCTDNLEAMGTLHRKFGRRCDWQGSWGRELLQARRRQERQLPWGR